MQSMIMKYARITFGRLNNTVFIIIITNYKLYFVQFSRYSIEHCAKAHTLL